MQRIENDRVTDLERDDIPLGEEGDVDRLVRLTARFCSLLLAEKRKSWFHSEVRSHVRDLRADLQRCLRRGPVRMEIHPETLRMGEARYESPPRIVRQFARLFERKRLSVLEIEEGVTEVEIVNLCRILQSKTSVPDSAEMAKLRHVHLERSDEPGFETPQILRRSRLGEFVDEAPGAGDSIRADVANITLAIDRISASEEEPLPQETVALAADAGGLLELVDNLGSNAEIALILSSLRRHDEYTYDHSVNVGLLSICLARALGWSGRDLREFGIAALIHDVGKLYTPIEVLNKPGRFTPQEWIIMKQHPRDGFEILREGAVGSPIAPGIALKHHIAFDGTGYPVVNDNPVEDGAQIVRIADVYDAFTTIRPYRSQSRPQEVLKMLGQQAGANFKPEFIEAFCEMMGQYPIGSTVKLESGRLGLVVDVHPQGRDRPVVKVLQDEDGIRPLGLELVNLRAKDPLTGQYVDGVVETVDPVIRNIPVGRYI